MQMEGIEVSHRKEELRRAMLDLRDRGLHSAAKFAAELLSGIRPLLSPSNNIASSTGRPDASTFRALRAKLDCKPVTESFTCVCAALQPYQPQK